MKLNAKSRFLEIYSYFCKCSEAFRARLAHYIPVWCPPVLAVLAVLYIVYGIIVYVFINVLSYCLYLF